MFWKKKPAAGSEQFAASEDQQDQKASPQSNAPSLGVKDSGFSEEHAAEPQLTASSAVAESSSRRTKRKTGQGIPAKEAKNGLEATIKKIKAASPVGYLAGILNPPDPAPGLAYAGIWRRYAAFLIDFPLSLAAAISAELLAKAALPKALMLNGLMPIILMFIAQFAYFVFFEGSSWKATPGKRLLKLRVTDKRGQKITRLRATVRLLVGLPFMAILAGFFMIAFNRKRQSAADRITSTLVVRKTSESFLPTVAKPFEFPVVIIISLALTYGAMVTTAKMVLPIVDRMTIRLMTEASLELMAPAQKAVEGWVAKNKSLPTQLDNHLIGYSKKGTPHTIAYNSSSGAITLWFMSGTMQGQGLSLIPTLEKGSEKIVWRCAGVNMDVESTPGVCAPSRR